jgi:DNA-binding transcriptional MerR regulator
MYKIGMFSKMNRVTVKALRYYDETGLLIPAYIDDFTGYRYYTSDQLPVLHQILALRQMGFTIEEIAAVQKGTSPEKLLHSKKEELLKTIGESTLKLAQVEHYLNLDKGGFDLDYNVVIKELPEVIVASMRKVVKNYDEFFKIVPPMGEEMGRLGCVCALPEYCFTIYHDGEFKEENIDAEVCEAVIEARQESDMVKFKTIPSVPQAACALHRGPYETLGRAYAALLKWMDNNGYEPADNPRESYIDGIWNKETPEEWLTEVQFPMKKKEV